MKSILTYARTDEAKRLRRLGIENFQHRTLQVRTGGGISNALTSVTKDNLVIETWITK